MKTKEELQKEINKIVAKEERELIRQYYPEFKKLIGKCFKVRNSYGGGHGRWWKYSKVISVKKDSIYRLNDGCVSCHLSVTSFERTSLGVIEFILNEHSYAHSLDKRISTTEFYKALNGVQKEIKSI